MYIHTTKNSPFLFQEKVGDGLPVATHSNVTEVPSRTVGLTSPALSTVGLTGGKGREREGGREGECKREGGMERGISDGEGEGKGEGEGERERMCT